MSLLKLKFHDEEKERAFDLENLRKLTTAERFQMMFEKAKITKELLKAHGHSPPPQIVKRK